MEKYLINNNFVNYNCLVITNRQKDLGLYLESPNNLFEFDTGNGKDVYFMSDKYKFTKWNGPVGEQQSIKITARDLNVYPSQIKDELFENIQYLEIGAGLGEFACKIAMTKGFPKPIIIDPINYKQLENMLIFAQTELFDKLIDDKSREILKFHTPRIKVLIERCKILQDPSKVILYNTTLEEASKIKLLKNSADLVVDFWGPKLNSDYRDRIDQKKIDEAEIGFLKNNGKLIQRGWNEPRVCVYNSLGSIVN